VSGGLSGREAAAREILPTIIDAATNSLIDEIKFEWHNGNAATQGRANS
jgi:hypothetical protein